ncbi:hypothetical protein DFH06DRAFT_1151901 [Mycena polygramma]|nr:hypothetical protein DFH06DRAFT_1151901 [Mycena polygramma]
MTLRVTEHSEDLGAVGSADSAGLIGIGGGIVGDGELGCTDITLLWNVPFYSGTWSPSYPPWDKLVRYHPELSVEEHYKIPTSPPPDIPTHPNTPETDVIVVDSTVTAVGVVTPLLENLFKRKRTPEPRRSNLALRNFCPGSQIGHVAAKFPNRNPEAVVLFLQNTLLDENCLRPSTGPAHLPAWADIASFIPPGVRARSQPLGTGGIISRLLPVPPSSFFTQGFEKEVALATYTAPEISEIRYWLTRVILPCCLLDLAKSAYIIQYLDDWAMSFPANFEYPGKSVVMFEILYRICYVLGFPTSQHIIAPLDKKTLHSAILSARESQALGDTARDFYPFDVSSELTDHSYYDDDYGVPIPAVLYGNQSSTVGSCLDGSIGWEYIYDEEGSG